MSLKSEIALLRAVVERLVVNCSEEELFSKSGVIASYLEQIERMVEKEKHFDYQMPEPTPIAVFDAEIWSDALLRSLLDFVEGSEVVDKAFEPKLNPPGDLTDEEWREYDIPGRDEPYRIYDPVKLYTRPGGTTHRVLDEAGQVHCIAFPGNGVVLRWKPRDSENPVAF